MDKEKTGGAAFGVAILAWLITSAVTQVITFFAYTGMYGITAKSSGGLLALAIGIGIGIWWKKNPEISIGRAAGTAALAGIGVSIVAVLIANIYVAAAR